MFSKAVGTKRFKYGFFLLLFSIIGILFISHSKESVQQEWETISSDHRYSEEYWKNASDKERDALAREKMSISVRRGHLEYGPYMFFFIGMISVLSILLSFVNIKSKADKLIEKMEKEDEESKE